MDSKKEKLLKRTFDDFIELMLYDFPVERMGDLIAEDVSGYGTTVDEKFLEIKRFKKVVTDQREQGAGIEMLFRITPIHRRVSPDEDTAIFMDEFEITMVIDGVKNVLPLRLTSVFEFLENNWKLVHIHGSKAVETEGDTWHMEEWKKKNEELQKLVDHKTADLEKKNRELEIEAALERVRARTMGMHKSEELKEVIQIVYEQFVNLNIRVEHAGFIMDYKTREDMHIWLADQHEVPSLVTIPYFDSPHWNSYIKAKEKGQDFFANHLTFDEKNKFYQDLFKLIPGVPEETSEYYFSCPGLAISTVLLDSVGLYIENFSGIPYTGEENNTLMRFGKVFQQTYTRFLDLQKAEAQAREAQIEAALERTRTQSMLMQQSDEIINISAVFHQQLLQLNIPTEFSYVWLPDEQKNDHQFWASWEEDDNGNKTIKSKQVTYPLDKSESYTAACYAAWASPEPTHIQFIPPDDVPAFFDVWQELLDGAKKLKARSFPQGIYYAEAYMRYGCFGINIRRELSQGEKEVLKKFSIEFERAYTRFLDLQKAEAQAREALVELSLERIRAQVTTMQESSDLLDIVVIMQAEFTKLGHEAHYFWHMRWLPDKYEKALTNGDGTRIGNVLELPRGFHGLKNMMAWEKSNEPFAVFALNPDTAADYIDKMIKLGRFREIDHSAPGPDEVREMDGLTFVMARTTHGEIGYTLPGEVPNPPEKDIATLVRFAGVFDLAYRRFEDLKSAERQTREAVKQSSLDRVRGQIASMRNATDLQQITPLIWNELKALEVPFFRCGVFIVDDKNKHVQVYLTTPEGNSLGVLDLDFEMSDLTRDTVRSWRQKEVYQTHWNKEEFIVWTSEMMKLQQVDTPEQYQGAEEPPASLYLHFIPFAQGMLYVGHVDQLQEEKIDLVKSLAEAFSFAYARYQDFVVLEEAKERVERALGDLKATQTQLIHAEKMASLGELTAGIAHEIQNPLNFVNNFAEVSLELIDEMKQESSVVSHQSSVVSHQSAMEIIDDIRQNLDKILHHGKRADGIVKGMLQHSRTSTGQKEPTDINTLADEYLRLAYHGLRAKDKSFNATLKTDFDESIGKINIIPQEIGRVILNLITNAFYAVDEKKKQLASDLSGLKTLTGLKDYEPTVAISTKKSGGNVLISVKDDGNGIPEEIKNKIFQPFFTTKPTGQGTGLGLSLSYDIIKAHGGSLDVESKENEFTAFTISIPV